MYATGIRLLPVAYQTFLGVLVWTQIFRFKQQV